MTAVSPLFQDFVDIAGGDVPATSPLFRELVDVPTPVVDTVGGTTLTRTNGPTNAQHPPGIILPSTLEWSKLFGPFPRQERLVGRATVLADSAVVVGLNADLLGEAFFNIEQERLSSQMLGEAIVTSDAQRNRVVASAMTGVATLTADLQFIKLISADLEGIATFEANLDIVRPINNPPLAGDLVDIGNSAVFQLTVDSDLLDLTSVTSLYHVWNVGELTVSYDGKELAFSEFTTISSPSYQPENTVELDVDFGDGLGLQRLFTGRIKTRESIGRNNNEEVFYGAVGNQILADDVTLLNTTGQPNVEFTVGTTVTSVTLEGTNVATTFSKPIRDAVQELFEIASSQLNSVGIPATIGFPGLEQFTSLLPETVEFRNIGFNAAIKQLAAYEIGVRPIFDDSQQKWVFHNLLNVPTVLVNVASMNIPELPFNADTTDRYTAVRLFGDVDDFLDDAILSKTTSIVVGGTPGQLIRTTVDLTIKWREELEPTWTIPRASSFDVTGLEDAYFWVFRRWSIPSSVIRPFPGSPVRAYANTAYWSENVWRRIHGRANFGRREFVARFPALKDGNPYIPGGVIGAEEVKLAYIPRQFLFTYVSSVTSAGTETLSTTQVDIEEFPETLRMPASGYEGSAFSEFGIEREYFEIVSRTEVTTANARARLDLRKDVVVSGDLPAEGDPLAEFMNLGVKALIQHPSKVTGVQSVPALVTQYTYTFGKRGESTLSLTTDIVGLIRQ